MTEWSMFNPRAAPQPEWFVGKRVRAFMDYDKPDARVEGTLLAVTDDGEFDVLDDEGITHFCWPLLKVETLDDIATKTFLAPSCPHPGCTQGVNHPGPHTAETR